MPVFDFQQDSGGQTDPVVTYTTYYFGNHTASPAQPLLILDPEDGILPHHSLGFFTSPKKRTAFTFVSSEHPNLPGKTLDIKKADVRFTSLISWLGQNQIRVMLSGEITTEGYAVYQIRETAGSHSSKLSGNNGFLQFMIGRLLSAGKPHEQMPDPTGDLTGSADQMKITSLQSITDFMTCAGKTLPDTIRLWASRNLAVARSPEVTQEERRHAQRALSFMMNIQWKNEEFAPIDPVAARNILDEGFYGLEQVKQRIIETIIQINRTHTLPFYGILLIGPAGTGKSQIAYAVAKILKMPWTTLDMSSISDPEQLTGSSRIYANAKPGMIMEAFSSAGSSNLVFIINELDKATSGGGKGNPADVLLTLLDNLGFTDNYIECLIPTTGVYPIATANEKSRISAPLMSRFAVIEIPDYTPEEKQIIFSDFVLPKVLKRIGLLPSECVISASAMKEIISIFCHTSGIRDLEQAAERLAANALYQIEALGKTSVAFEAEDVRRLLLSSP